MKLRSRDRSNIAQTAAVSLLTVAALTVLAVVVSHWTWAWLAPVAEPRAELAAESGNARASATGLFGKPEIGQDRNIAQTGLAFRLLGIVAATAGHPGFAVVQFEPRQIRAVRAGEEIAPGIQLAEVEPDHVVLERAGVREMLSWPKKNKSAEVAAPRIVN
jgi:general secretion pathway protein C